MTPWQFVAHLCHFSISYGLSAISVSGVFWFESAEGFSQPTDVKRATFSSKPFPRCQWASRQVDNLREKVWKGGLSPRWCLFHSLDGGHFFDTSWHFSEMTWYPFAIRPIGLKGVTSLKFLPTHPMVQPNEPNRFVPLSWITTQLDSGF